MLLVTSCIIRRRWSFSRVPRSEATPALPKNRCSDDCGHPDDGCRDDVAVESAYKPSAEALSGNQFFQREVQGRDCSDRWNQTRARGHGLLSQAGADAMGVR